MVGMRIESGCRALARSPPQNALRSITPSTAGAAIKRGPTRFGKRGKTAEAAVLYERSPTATPANGAALTAAELGTERSIETMFVAFALAP